MHKNDKLDVLIDKLLAQETGSTFTVNNKWQCEVKSSVHELEWKKDINSPSVSIEIPVDVCSTEDVGVYLAGIVLVQSDMSLSRKYYASLYMKNTSDQKWKCMLSVVDIKLGDN